ncbi:MAG: hypothetical protein QOK07_2727, partial [Gemmatimonadaceae bacterium]|nr:hypothetical protein [Gemmatimonadaceae bacterium]
RLATSAAVDAAASNVEPAKSPSSAIKPDSALTLN